MRRYRNHCGSTSLLEVLSVLVLMGILVPLMATIMLETDQRLNPMGRSGRRIQAVQTANTILTRLQMDLDRTWTVKTPIVDAGTGDRELVLEQDGTTVRYRYDGSTLFRINDDYGVILGKNITDWELSVNGRTLTVRLSVQPVDPGAKCRTFQTVYPI